MEFAVVDVEATGGTRQANRIIEIGVVLTDGFEVENTFQTLVDPGRDVPPFVQRLTGIRQEELASAPQFGELAEGLAGMLSERVFVAHNVGFDYAIVSDEMRRALCPIELRQLCTLRLSRKFFPGHGHYKLGDVAAFLCLPEFEHHRALGDAMAAAGILKRVLEEHGEAEVEKLVSRRRYYARKLK